MKINKTVYFFTDSTDTSFIYNDILNFSEMYDKVKVYASTSGNSAIMPANVNVKVVDFNAYNTKTVLFNNFLSVGSAVTMELIHFPKYLFYPKIFIKAISAFLRNIYLAEMLCKESIDGKNSIFFTFWFNGWATTLAHLKKKGKIESFFSRIHGTDLFEFRIPVTHHIPFRKFQLKHVTRIFSVSKNGADYLIEKYPAYKTKVTVNYLGVKGYTFKPLDKNGVFTIVSCSIMDIIKRVYLIPEILKHIKAPVKWIHIGQKVLTDPTMPFFDKKLQELMRDHKNVQVEILGFLPNDRVFELYGKNSINLFLSCSDSEGLPVSMMEATGFGIPVMATDVGGCKEIVTERTGILISQDFDPKHAADLISNFMSSEKNTDEFRKSVHQFCRENFDMDTNFSNLNKELRLAAKQN
jgi:glycosyltransferase involved in cell wall biosynthesis